MTKIFIYRKKTDDSCQRRNVKRLSRDSSKIDHVEQRGTREESEKQKGAAASFRTIRREKRTSRRNVVVLFSVDICDFEAKIYT